MFSIAIAAIGVIPAFLPLIEAVAEPKNSTAVAQEGKDAEEKCFNHCS